MGYRNYFAFVKKEYVCELRNLTEKELFSNYEEESDNWISFSSLLENDLQYELGKDITLLEEENICRNCESLFLDSEMNLRFKENNPRIIGREGIVNAINNFKKHIVDMYSSYLGLNEEKLTKLTELNSYELLDKYEDGTYEIDSVRVTKFLLNRFEMWKHDRVLDLRENNNLVLSWQYEHEIFQLTYLLKTIDFNKYDVIYYGY